MGTADGPRQVAQDRTTGELVTQFSEQVSRLVREELRLAGVELTGKFKRYGVAAKLYGGAGLVALYGMGMLLGAIVLGMVEGGMEPWLAAAIVAAVLLVMAAALAMLGRKRMREGAPPLPEETIDSVKSDVREIRERAAR